MPQRVLGELQRRGWLSLDLKDEEGFNRQARHGRAFQEGPGHRERRYEITESLESARDLASGRRQAVEMGYGKDL